MIKHDLHLDYFVGGGFPDTGTITIHDTHGVTYGINGQNWGSWNSDLHGTYAGIRQEDRWFLKWEDASPDIMRRFLFAHGWKFDSMGEIEAEVSGGWVNIQNATTGIIEGGLHGAYNPNNPDNNFFMVSGGLWMSTERFLEMAGKIGNNPDVAKLNRLNIPSVEIGRANLVGSSGIMDVHMNDVIFFKFPADNQPMIWATSSITGTYSSVPGYNHNVALHDSGMGNDISATYQVKHWGGGKWDAKILHGNGTLKRTDTTGVIPVGFAGEAAGKYVGTNSGSFNGTGAGWAHSPD